MNESDSQRIASFLEQQKYRNTDKIQNADLIVVNACSVRQTATDRIFGLKNKFKKLKAKKILTGCVLKADKKKFEEFFNKILSINDFFKYHKFFDRTNYGKNYFVSKPKYLSKNSAFVPIMTGCNNFCAYCVVPYTRGREISRSVKEIIEEVKCLVKRGYKEITLLGQNVNSYKYDFVELLKKLNSLSGDFQIKFLTNHPKDMSDELINTIAKYKKIAKEIHLPIQSGDDKILKKMNRGYAVKQYKDLVKKIKKIIPDVKLSTDVIVGFPGETKKQFENTVKLFKEIKFDKAYINKYSTRPGTIAAKFKDNVSWEEKKRRWRILDKIINKPKKLIVIVGPTASGKSELAIKIAKKFGGEIVSADSRQIYKEMDIGTAKPFRSGIPHYCINITSPKKQFTVAEYRKLALEAINKIYKKGKIPILCGGTGFYIQAVVEGLNIPRVKPDWNLRRKLEKKTTEQLFGEVKKLDPRRAKTIDVKNKRRLIRAIEIILKTGKPIPSLEFSAKGGPASGWNVLYLGIKKSPQELKRLINQRVEKMIKKGLEKELKKLVKKYGWTIVLKNAIGYQEWRGKNPIKNTKLHTYQFAKRQMTWFKKYPGKKIIWIKDYPETEKLVKKFLSR